MSKLDFKTNTLIAFFVISSFITLFHTASADDHFLKTPEQGYDLNIDLTMDGVPALGKAISAHVNVDSTQIPIEQLTIELIIPEGIQLVQQLQQKSTAKLYPNNPINNDFQFIAFQPGQYKITAKVEGWTEQGQIKDRYEYLFFSVNENSTKNKLGWDKTDISEGSQWVASEIPELMADDNGYVTVPAADQELNETTRLIPAHEYYGNQTEGSTVTISGRYQFRNRENNANVGFNRNAMRLINSNNGDHLEWTYSDNNGYFTFPAVTNPGNDGMRVRAYAVRYLNGKGYGVCITDNCDDQAASDSGSYDQFYYSQTQAFTRPDGNQNIGTYISPYSLSNNLRAQWIKNDIDKAHAHLVENSTIRGPFTIEWAADSTDGNYYRRDENIHLKSDVGDGTNHTVLHELGHNVMWNAGTFPAGTDCPSPHYMGRISGSQCAWTEGWAHIFLTLVNDDPIKCSPPSTTSCTLFESHPSFNYCGQYWDCGVDSDQVEGHVAGAVWDLYDDQNDDFDYQNFPIQKIYQVVENDTNTSFAAWWTSWRNDGNPYSSINSLFQNDILYGNLYDVRVNTPAVSHSEPNVGQNITASVNLRNLGNISSIATNINFYLSTNNIISPLDTLVGTNYQDVLDWISIVPSNKTFSIEATGNYWIGACFDDSYGLDQDDSNDCSEGVPVTVTDNDVIFESGFE